MAQDTAARAGGDEFALILPETPKPGAAVKAEQLRAFVERYDFSDLKGIQFIPSSQLIIKEGGIPLAITESVVSPVISKSTSSA